MRPDFIARANVSSCPKNSPKTDTLDKRPETGWCSLLCKLAKILPRIGGDPSETRKSLQTQFFHGRSDDCIIVEPY